MLRYSRTIAPLALTLALFAGACKDNKKENALTQDTSLSRDLELANRDTASQPQLKDIPDTTASSPESTPVAESKTPPRPAPRPAPKRTTTPTTRTPAPSTAPTPAPRTTPSGNIVDTAKAHEGALATVAAGTMINLASNDRVCTNTAHAGDRFTATVKDAITGSNGAVIPAGAKAVVVVTQLKRSENASDPIQMTFNVTSISWNGKTYPIDATIDHVDVEKVRSASKGSDIKKVGIGAVAGGIIGTIIGHNVKGAVIGAATGAAAGTAVAMGTADYDGCVPSGGNIRIKLNSPATIQAD